MTPRWCPHSRRPLSPAPFVSRREIESMRSLAVVVFALTMVAPALGVAQSNAGQAMDATFAAHVKEWTTKPEFVSPLVDHLPAATTVPTPRDVIGHDIGAPNKLDYYEDLLKYYRTLAPKPRRGRTMRHA